MIDGAVWQSVVIPVSAVERAKKFYGSLGWQP